MSTVRLKFKIPEEKYAFDAALHGLDCLAVLRYMDGFLRDRIMFSSSGDVALEELRNVRCELNTKLEEYGISIYD